MTLFNPDSWLDIAAYGIYGLPALIWALASWRDQKKVLEEVKNKHSTNLREDLDIIRDEIRGLSKDFVGLRDELRQERQERIEGDQR